MKTIMTFRPETMICQFVVCSYVGQPLAVVQCFINSHNGEYFGEIRNLVVFEAYRRQGVAGGLLQTVLRTLQDTASGLPKLDRVLASVDERYIGADHVFETCGFEPIESHPHGTLYEFTWRHHAITPLH